MKTKKGFVISLIIFTALIGFVGFNIFAREQKESNELARGNSTRVSPDSNQDDKQKDVTFSLLKGGTLSLAEYRGKKPIILDFFATWCPNCRRNTPHLNELYKKYKDQVEIIGVNLHEDPGVVRQFADSYNLTFPVALDETSSVANQFGVRYTNTHVFIDLNGAVLRVVSGDVQERDILALIKN